MEALRFTIKSESSRMRRSVTGSAITLAIGMVTGAAAGPSTGSAAFAKGFASGLATGSCTGTGGRRSFPWQSLRFQ